MESLPLHVLANQSYWTEESQRYAEPGRRAWSSSEITWGIWNLPESQVGALGDLSWFRDKDSVELGCGTGYLSSWLARLGARPVGVDITPAQLETARLLQAEFGVSFPLLFESAEETSLPGDSFDFVLSEYGASIWCDPKRWIPEAARLLRPGGRLVFLRNSTISMLCSPKEGVARAELVNDYASLERMNWDGSFEFHLPTGPMLRLLVDCGFVVKNLLELFPPADQGPTRFDYMDVEWARRWPAEELWCATYAG